MASKTIFEKKIKIDGYRGAPAPAHEFSSAERKSCSNALLIGAELFEQLFSKELN